MGQSRSNIALDAAIQLENENNFRRKSTWVKRFWKRGGNDDELDVIQERFLTSGHDDEETKFYNNQLDEQVAKMRATTIMKKVDFSIDGNFEKTSAIPIPRGDGSNHGGGLVKMLLV